MDKKLKSKWVAALRSGKYTQGHTELKTIHADKSVSFCCLGVLKDICPSIRKMNGMDLLSTVTSGIPRDTQDFLANHNDGYDFNHWGFKRIATWIEKNL